MTITQLKYILAIAEHQNFTKAANACFVTQPTLSTQIQKLEDELNVQIFDRNKKPIELTEIGKKIVVQAQNIVVESDRIQDIVDQQKGFVGGEFKLGIIPTIMPTLLPLFLKTFIKKFPKIKLTIEEHSTKDILKLIKDGKLDAAIAATPLETEGVKERVLFYEPFLAYMPKSSYVLDKTTLEVSDLNLNEVLLLKDGHCFRDSVINLCNTSNSLDLNDNLKLESGSMETLIKLCNDGLGYTLLPYLHTLDLSAENKSYLKEFTKPNPSREVSLIYNSNQLKIQIIDALFSTISSVIRGIIQFEDVKIISPLKQKERP